MIGIRTTLSRLVPTKDHVKAARIAGHDVDTELRTLIRQMEDCHQLARKIPADLERSNPRDPNAETLAEVLAALS
jgi:hypothetical protein